MIPMQNISLQRLNGVGCKEWPGTGKWLHPRLRKSLLLLPAMLVSSAPQRSWTRRKVENSN
jgi:hypothetical protein